MKEMPMRFMHRLHWASKLIISFGLILFGLVHSLAAESAFIEHYETKNDVIARTFSKQSLPFTETKKISPALQKTLQQKLGSRWEINQATFDTIKQDNKILGYTLILEEIGKHEPITFCIALSPKNDILEVAVLTYRETIGGEIRKKRFMKQFYKKSDATLPQISKTIPITGATLSSWASVMAVKKAVILGRYVITSNEN